MDHRKFFRARLIIMTAMAVAGIALVVAHEHATISSATPKAAVNQASHDAPQPASVDPANASAPQEAAPNGDSTAACRKAPECSVDSDCDIICGVGLGKCVHASCPIRICKCH